MGLLSDCLITQVFKTVKAVNPGFMSLFITASQLDLHNVQVYGNTHLALPHWVLARWKRSVLM